MGRENDKKGPQQFATHRASTIATLKSLHSAVLAAPHTF